LRLSLKLLLLLLDLLLDLGVFVALARSIQRREGVRSDQEGAGAQGNVLRAAHFSDLPVVEVTTDTTGKVAELVADHKSDALAVRGNLDATSNNLDTTVGHVHDFSNGLGVLLGNANGLGELNLLSVDLDNHSLARLRAGTLLLLLLGSAGDELNLVGTAEEDGDDLTRLLLDVLGEDSHRVAARAVLDEDSLTSLNGLLFEGVGNVVEGVDVVALKGTLRV